jgi:hypothetical protein
MDIKLRFAYATAVAGQYDNFRDFAEDGMAFLGFPLTDMQADIAEYMQDGPTLRMVMAQRGEAKSTLAALYAVWRLIQRTNCRVLIVSGGEKQASEVALLVIRVIMQAVVVVVVVVVAAVVVVVGVFAAVVAVVVVVVVVVVAVVVVVVVVVVFAAVVAVVVVVVVVVAAVVVVVVVVAVVVVVVAVVVVVVVVVVGVGVVVAVVDVVGEEVLIDCRYFWKKILFFADKNCHNKKEKREMDAKFAIWIICQLCDIKRRIAEEKKWYGHCHLRYENY